MTHLPKSKFLSVCHTLHPLRSFGALVGARGTLGPTGFWIRCRCSSGSFVFFVVLEGRGISFGTPRTASVSQDRRPFTTRKGPGSRRGVRLRVWSCVKLFERIWNLWRQKE